MLDIRGFELALKASGYKPDTIRRATGTTRHFIQWCAGRNPSEPDSVEAFLGDASERVRRITLRNYHADLVLFFRWALSKGFVDENPLDHIPRPVPSLYERERDTRFLPYTEADRDSLLEVCPAFWQGWLGLRDRALLWVLWDTPLRASEITRLHEDDVDWEHSELKVRDGKGGVRYEAIIGIDCATALHDYWMERPASEFLFLDRHRQPMSSHALALMLQRLAKRAHWHKPSSPHCWRHNWRIRMRMLGLDDAAVSALMGHASVVVTHGYARQVARQLAKAQLRQKLA